MLDLYMQAYRRYAVSENKLQPMDSSVLDTNVYKSIRDTLAQARSKVYAAINFAMVEAYWEIGRQIEDAVGDRAEYGKGLLKYLSKQLTAEFGKGFDERNLRFMRQFYMTFPIWNALRSELSWTHYRLIMKIENPNARQFYIDECIRANWSTRQLERQITSFFYERLRATRKESQKIVSDEIHTLEPKNEPDYVLKDPYILEFLDLKENRDYLEHDLEQALIDKLQEFLLELGRGFTYESRQKRITFDGEHFYIDLVFYNYILKCFVLIDLKTGKLTHQDIGQMQMYVNYYTREMMNEGDNPPIGIILCSDKSENVVRYTLSAENTQIFTSKYKLYLPTEEELKRELERERELIERQQFLNKEDDE
jgi:predicted nuclease of restriction endonuclease-like (RecB) superfamily